MMVQVQTGRFPHSESIPSRLARLSAPALAMATVLLLVSEALGHPTSMSGGRAWVHDDSVSLALDLDVRTLVEIFGDQLERNADGAVTFGRSRHYAALRDYLLANLEIANGADRCSAGEV